jgi:hypothetical protein
MRAHRRWSVRLWLLLPHSNQLCGPQRVVGAPCSYALCCCLSSNVFIFSTNTIKICVDFCSLIRWKREDLTLQLPPPTAPTRSSSNASSVLATPPPPARATLHPSTASTPSQMPAGSTPSYAASLYPSTSASASHTSYAEVKASFAVWDRLCNAVLSRELSVHLFPKWALALCPFYSFSAHPLMCSAVCCTESWTAHRVWLERVWRR